MTACERARQWISLDLDGQLSELEQAALGRHLDGCASCRAFSARVGGFTWMLRAEPLAAPERRLLLAGRRPRRARIARRGAAALALAAAAATVAALLASPRGAGPVTSSLRFNSVAEQKRFAHEHLRAEPQAFVVEAVLPSAVPSFAARALG